MIIRRGPLLNKRTFCNMRLLFFFFSFLREKFYILSNSSLQAIEKVEAVLGAYQGTTLPSTIHAQLGMRPVLVHAGGVGNLRIMREIQ